MGLNNNRQAALERIAQALYTEHCLDGRGKGRAGHYWNKLAEAALAAVEQAALKEEKINKQTLKYLKEKS